MSRMPCPLHTATLRHPDAAALVAASGQTISFADCDAKAAAVAAALRSAGLSAGARIALMEPPDLWSLAILFGAFRAGCAVYIPNARLPRPALLEHLAHTDCRGVVASAQAGELPHRVAPDDLLAYPNRLAVVEVEPDAPATLIATSGSTNVPKLAVLSLGNHLANAAASNKNLQIQPGDRWLLSLPWHHVSGLGIVFRCLLAGAAVALPEPQEALEHAIARLDVTHLSLVAAQLQRLLSTPSGQHALRRLKAVLVGGGATPARLIERAVTCEIPLYSTYGLTETASQVATSPPGATLGALKTSGLPLTAGTVRIASSGEIQVHGRTLFLGYLQHDGTLRRPLTSDGWFPTGDLGRLDEAGNLVLTGRKDNLFVSGGENIQPEEIETALCAFQDVARAIVVPVPDPEFGSRPVAFIAPAPGFTREPDALRARLAKTLPRYKLPAHFLDWPEDTPQTGLKPSRAALQHLAIDRLREHAQRPSAAPPEP